MTRPTTTFFAGYLLLACLQAAGYGDEVKLVEEGGVTYRETVRYQREAVTTPRVESQERTVYQDRIVTEMRDAYRTVYTPVTEYRAEPRWHNWWNPFGRPYIAYHMRPRTHWEARHERYQTPYTYRERVPTVQTVQVVTREPHFVDRKVIERVAVSPPARAHVVRRPSLAPSPVNAASEFRSARIDNDPPRLGTSTRY